MFEKILEFDQKTSSKLVLSSEKKTLRKAASFFAHSGDSWFWLAALFIIWLFSKGILHTYSALFAGAIVLQALLVLAIKFKIKRKRPEGEWGAVYRNIDPHSFPSGHAVRAFMIAAMAWGLGLQPWAWILIIWAALVCLARVGMGVHYLSDVLAGCMIGILLALAVLWAQPILYQWFPFILFN
jgi:undecaprenyl-diphosphatase